MNNQEPGLFDTIFTPHSRRSFLKRAGALGLSGTALTAFLEACGGTTTTGSTPAAIPVGPIDMQTLTSNAKKEGQLQAIGIPPEWADYKDILAGYTKNYGINIAYQAEAEFTSAQELEVFKNSVKHPHGDIGDVGLKFGPTSVKQGLVTPRTPRATGVPSIMGRRLSSLIPTWSSSRQLLSRTCSNQFTKIW